MSNSSNWPIPTLRKSGKWILLATIIGVAAYRMKLSPTRVVGHEAASGPIVAVVVGTGTLEARVKSTISARIQERLAEVLVDQNDPVKAGQLLARLDDGESRTQVELAEAMRVAAQATLQRVKTDEARAQAVARQAFLAHQRASGLLTNQISSQADFDKSVEQLNVAEADVKRSQAAIAEAESQAVTAGKTLAYQKERLTYTQIISPYDGLITRRDRDPGGVVVPGSSILQMISTNEIWVSAWVDETSAAGLLPGQP
ncbi:MAG: efflux RND transporter periplasmic adaptor subunit, partial [Verrucomicrobia bacterium]|nr:efflux RND transporter periplasmic adaptor subunit [Verrucomicrobiota bacterium]